MKRKFLLLISIIILGACSTSPSPDAADKVAIQRAEIVTYESGFVRDIEPMVITDEMLEPQDSTPVPDTTKKKKNEEIEELKRENDIQQKRVLEQIEKLEQQQMKLDSILEKKKNGEY